MRIGRAWVKRPAAAAVAVTAVMLLWAWLVGEEHDYVAYRQIWRNVLDGRPWGGLNSYGPLFALFAPLAHLWWFIPKMCFVVGFMAGVWAVASRVPGSPANRWRVAAALAFHPAPLWLVGAYGLNDGLVAGLVAWAALARSSGEERRSGVLLGVAALLKFYPLLFAVMFAVPFRRRDVRVLGWASAVFGVGMSIAVAVGGGGALSAVREGGVRGPKLLSVFAAFEAHPGWWGSGMMGVLAAWNWVLVVAAAALCVWVAVRWQWTWLEAGVVGSAVVFAVYKVGHPQFWLSWLLLVALLLMGVDGGERGRRLGWWSVGWAVFLAVFQVGYVATGWFLGSWQWVRSNVGFVSFWAALAGPVGWWWCERRRVRGRTLPLREGRGADVAAARLAGVEESDLGVRVAEDGGSRGRHDRS